MAFDDGQDIMEGQSGHALVPQAHDITQHKTGRILCLLTADVEGLQLTQIKGEFTSWM